MMIMINGLKKKEKPHNPLAMTGDISNLPDKLKYINVIINEKCPKCGVSGYVQLLIPGVKKCWSCNTTFEFEEFEEQEEQLGYENQFKNIEVRGSEFDSVGVL